MRARRATAAVAVAITCAATATAVTVLGPPAAAAPALPAGLVPVVTHQSLLGTHAWYRQTHRGLPVLDSFYAVHTARNGAATVDDGRLAVPATLDVTPTVAASGAVSGAAAAVAASGAVASKSNAGRLPKNATAVPAFGTATPTLAVVGGATPALVWDVLSSSASGDTETRVDAHTGKVLATIVRSKNATGTAKVFDPNPVVKLKNQNLKDKQDSNASVPTSAYTAVTLQHLSAGTKLGGKYAVITAASVPVATSSSRAYVYQRADDRFEQVNAYYGVDKAQTYIQSLGFDDINNEAQKLKIDTISDDNSFYRPSDDTITYGTGGVDDAEDLEVVWHEYGHAIQDAQVPNFGNGAQAGAIGEGFGDYWAVSLSQTTSKGYGVPCVMDWDATSYTSSAPHCLRRVDTDKTTDDIDGEVHDDGEIWSAALWDVTQSLGRVKANTIVLESQFSYAPNTSFAAAAKKVVATADSLYGSAAAASVRKAFVARKILS
ncbi:M4 family metallopeptidase [Jatrophihabitans sp. YIM 134969]